jgi:hypothetical protein
VSTVFVAFAATMLVLVSIVAILKYHEKVRQLMKKSYIGIIFKMVFHYRERMKKNEKELFIGLILMPCKILKRGGG